VSEYIHKSHRVVTLIKSLTAREVFKRCPQVKKQLWGGEFWSDGYFASKVSRYLVKDFGTSKFPKSTRKRDAYCAPDALRPYRFATLPQMAGRRVRCLRCIPSGASARRVCYERPTPTGDYQPSLRSSWLAATVGKHGNEDMIGKYLKNQGMEYQKLHEDNQLVLF